MSVGHQHPKHVANILKWSPAVSHRHDCSQKSSTTLYNRQHHCSRNYLPYSRIKYSFSRFGITFQGSKFSMFLLGSFLQFICERCIFIMTWTQFWFLFRSSISRSSRNIKWTSLWNLIWFQLQFSTIIFGGGKEQFIIWNHSLTR